MDPHLKLSILVAVADNRVIGLNNTLPWKISADLARFKELTMNRVIVAGRKTHESILAVARGKPLAGRKTVVLTRMPDYQAPGCIVLHHWDEVVEHARQSGEEIFIIGGTEIYELALPHVTRMYLTRVHAEPVGDAYFPEYNPDEWHLKDQIIRAAEPPKNQYPFTFEIWERKKAS